MVNSFYCRITGSWISSSSSCALSFWSRHAIAGAAGRLVLAAAPPATGGWPPVAGPFCAIASEVAPARRAAASVTVLKLAIISGQSLNPRPPIGHPRQLTRVFKVPQQNRRENAGAAEIVRHPLTFAVTTRRHCLIDCVQLPMPALPLLRTATWRSGYATVCKTVYPGSIPGVASSLRSRASEGCRAEAQRRRATLAAASAGSAGQTDKTLPRNRLLGHASCFQSRASFVICGALSRAGFSPVAQR